jgi:hypothetical protein
MPDEPEPTKEPLERLGDAVGECLPERWRTPEVDYAIGSVVGFLAGWLLTRKVLRWLLPDDKGDKK